MYVYMYLGRQSNVVVLPRPPPPSLHTSLAFHTIFSSNCLPPPSLPPPSLAVAYLLPPPSLVTLTRTKT